MHFKTEQYAQRVRKNGQPLRFTCTYEECPRFKTCALVPSHGILFGSNPKPQLYFVMDTTTEDEGEARLPAIHPAGRLLREALIAHILTKKRMPFVVTKLFRAVADTPRLFESKLCFSHFLKDLRAGDCKLVVALGMGVFNSFYANALNKNELPPKSDHTIASLRGKFFTFVFEGDLSVRVFIAHNPGAILQTPALYKLFKDDAHRLAHYLQTGDECGNKTSVTIKKIESLETSKEVFDYLDFLLKGGLKKNSLVAFDTETRNLNRRHNNAFLTWQFSHEEGHAVAFPIDHKEKPLFADPSLKRELALRMSKLVNATTAETNINFLIGHNIKFDLSVLWGLMRITPRDPRVNIPWWCTMLATHWLDENRKGLAGFLSGSPYSLKTLGVEYFDFYFEEEALDRRGDGALEDLSLKQLYTYGGSDVILTRALAVHQVTKLAAAEPGNAVPALKKFVKHYYFPSSRALAVMECNGIYVKQDHLSYLQGEDSPVWNRMDEIEHKLQNLPEVLDFRNKYKEKISGKVKNASLFEAPLWEMPEETLPPLDLNKQEQQTMFFLDYLRLNPIKMSRKTGKPSLNAAFLNHYANSLVYKETSTVKGFFSSYYGKEVGTDKEGAPVYNENPLALVLEYRKLKKLGTAYLDAIEGFLRNPRGDCTDSRVRASYNAHGTDSGRLCVPGDTKILVVTYGNEDEIKGKPIVNVKAGDLVYCYDDELNLRIRKVVWSGKTGTKQVVRLHWKTGTKKKGHLDLTPDHLVRLIDGSYRAAASLLPGDRMLSVSRSPYTSRRQTYAKIYARQGRPIKEHRFVFEQTNGYAPSTVHHKDHNPLNNHPSNLEAMTVAEHTSHHLKDHWKAGVFANKPTKGKNHYLYNPIGRYSFLRVLAECEGQHRNPKYSNHPKLIRNRQSFKRRCTEYRISKRLVALRYDREGNYISRGRLKKLCGEMARYRIREVLGVGDKQLGELASYYGFSFVYNHEVVRIEVLPGEVDVYDLEVEEFHNFIANEICVHNSSNSPNLQQLPGRGKVAKAVKNMFQAEPPSDLFPNGTILLQCDYKTAEVRWAALFAKDTNLIKVFQDSTRLIQEALVNDSVSDGDFKAANLLADLHRRTASLMFNMPADKVSDTQRQSAKCLVGNTLLYTNMGIVPIEKLVSDRRDEVWVQAVEGVEVASKNGSVEVRCINHKWVDSTIELETDLGLKIEGDKDHPLLVWRKCQLQEVTLENIEEGDFLVISRSNNSFPTYSPQIVTPADIATGTTEDKIVCRLCGFSGGNLNSHLTMHKISTEEYLTQFPASALVSSQQIAKRLTTLAGTKYNRDISKYPTEMCPELARLLGYMVAEGDTQNFIFAASTRLSAEMLADFRHCLKECFNYEFEYRTYPYSENSICRIPAKIQRYLESIDLAPAYANTKRVPEIILRSTREDIINYLKAYFEGDGSVSSNSIIVMSASESLIRETQQLLLSLGIASVIYPEKHTTPVGKEVRTYYGLRLRSRDANVFAKTVGFVSKGKQDKALKISDKRSMDYIYGLESLLYKLRAQYKTDYRGTYFAINGRKVKFGERVTKGGQSEVTHKWLAKNYFVLDAIKVWSEETNNNVYNDVNWLHQTRALLSPIVKKSLKQARQKVYDIEVADPSHTFCASGILSKNCITFGLLFGMSVKSLAENNGWTLEEGEEKLHKYFSAFPDLEAFLKRIPMVAKEKGYVETFMGRRRRLSNFLEMGRLADSYKHLSEGERKAMNASIQGQSSDAGMIGMFSFMQYIFDNNLEDRWLIQNVVHDSCLVQVPWEDTKAALAQMSKFFVKDMQHYIEDHWNCQLPIDIEIEFEIGLQYGALEKWDGRKKTLDKILLKLEAEKESTWKKVERAPKPPKALGLVTYSG